MFREKEICDAIRTAYLHLFPDKKERKRALSRLDLELVAQGVRYRGESVLAYQTSGSHACALDYYDLFIDLRHSTNLRTTAKELDVPERRFIRFLLERRYVYRTPSGCVLPYAKSANEGLFCVKDFCRNGHTGSYTLVTPKGKLHFAELRSLILVTV